MSDAAISTSKLAQPLADGGGYDMPRHVAIIMDGNGRWAAARIHLPALTLYAFPLRTGNVAQRQKSTS